MAVAVRRNQLRDPEAVRAAREQVAAEAKLRLPLYIASAIVALCGVGAVSSTLSEWEWSQQCILLILVGHAASFTMRLRGVPPLFAYGPVSVLLLLGILSQSGGLRPSLGLPSLDALPADQGLAVFICWLVAVRSFSLTTDGALLFSAVPTLAMLGLTGSSNPNVEIPILFGVFIFVTIFMVVFEQHLRRIQLSGQRPWALSWHLSTATTVFLLALVVGSTLGVVGGRTLGTLSPFAVSNLSRLNPTVQSFTQAAQTTSGNVPVGAGPIRLLPTPIFEVYSTDSGLYRTAVYEDYDGRSWAPIRQRPDTFESTFSESASSLTGVPAGVRLPAVLFRFPLGPAPNREQEVPTRRVRQLITALGPVQPMLPVLDRPVGVRYPENQLHFFPTAGVVRGTSFLVPGFTFEVTSEVPEFAPERLRQAPPGAAARRLVSESCWRVPLTAERIRPLAQEVTAGLTNDHDRVQAIIRHIERTCSYSLDAEPTPEGTDAVEFYLFETKIGACDLAASAAVMLSRAAGIPARVITGYLVDQPLPGQNGFLVRQMDAHMWFEVFFPGYGWVAFNPATPSRDLPQNPVSDTLSGLRRWLRTLSQGRIDSYLTFTVAVLLLIGLGGPIARWGRERLRAWHRERATLAGGGAPALGILYRRMGRMLGRRGWARDPAMTPDEYRAWLSREWGSASAAAGGLDRITSRFVRACYAGETATGAYAEAVRDFHTLRRAVPRRARSRRQRAGAGAATA